MNFYKYQYQKIKNKQNNYFFKFLIVAKCNLKILDRMGNALKKSEGFTFAPSNQKSNVLNQKDLWTVVEEQMQLTSKESFSLQGKEALPFSKIMNLMEQWTGRNHVGPKTLDGLISPLSNGLFASYGQDAEYRFF